MAVRQEVGLGQFPRQEKKGNTGKIAAGILAVAVLGGGAYAATQLNRNDGANTNPEITPPAGGIVEPSNSPIPTQVKPTESIVIPSATPEATPTPTPTKEPLVNIESIIESKHPKVTAEEFTTSVNSAYENNPQAESIWPVAKANRATNQCIKGDHRDKTEEEIRLSRATYCPIEAANLYRIYKFTGDTNFLDAAKATYDYSVNELNYPEYKDYLDEYLVKASK